MRDSIFARCLALPVALLILCAVGCDSSPGGAGSDDAGEIDASTDDAAEIDAATDDGDVDAGCTPTVMSCAGLCGPIIDSCTGTKLQCGGCPTGQVCDLVAHTCGTPLVSCMQLGATCGAIRNSCGSRLDCGGCAAGKECDPDTNSCVACTQVTCQDLGYECGQQWLGCGPETNTTNCGNCPANFTCNTVYKRCEAKTCSGKTAAQLCADAKTASGVECGNISNGCGGVVSCGGCPVGKGCGVRGVANRCEPFEPPVECSTLGKNCGTIPSNCGPPGTTVDCGVCPTGQVCNANGICGMPCAPLTCMSPQNVGKCFKQLDDGCMGKLDCGCGAGQVCSTTVSGMTGMCVMQDSCMTYGANGANTNPCSNGASPKFPKGDGTNLTCKCAGAAVCVAAMKVVSGAADGNCCTNAKVCAANECGTTKINDCTGATITCACTGDNHCNNATHLCEANKACSDYGANGQKTNPCSNGASPMFPKGDGTNRTCPCNAGLSCTNGMGTAVSGATAGTCCQNTNVCPANSCNTSVTDSCTGAIIPCGCGNTQYCDTTTNTCKPKNTCATYTDQNAGSPCSNGASPTFPDGAGGNLTCRCAAGQGVCVNGMVVVSGATSGTCCINTKVCGANECGTTKIDECTGAIIQCTCNNNQYCSAANLCVAKKTCGSYLASGAIGAPCSDTPIFDDGSMMMSTTNPFSCPCTTSGGLTNNMCVGGSSSLPGTCQCVANQCNGKCANSVQPNGCGGTIDCRCTGGQVCNPQTQACCAPFVCQGAGAAGAECGIVHPSCGSTVTCQCAGPYNTCGGGGVPNVCGCTKDTCKGRVGSPPDLCGGFLSCGG